MQTELSCPVCGIDYSEDRLPRILAICGHSFCEVCIEQKIMQDGEGKFYLCCPEDNMRCQMNTKDVRQIPINRSLLKIAQSTKVKTPHKDTSFELSKTTKEEEFQEDMDIHEFKDPAHINLIEQSPYTKTHFECPDEQDSSLDEQNLCLLHQKPLEIVCVYDLQKVCAKCAIFGEHKGHEFKSLEQIEDEKLRYCEHLEAVFGLKKEIMDRIEKKTTKSDLISILNQKSLQLSKQIKQKFKTLIDALKAEETKILVKLDQINRKVEKQIDSLYKIDSVLIDQYEEWESSALLKLDEIKKGNFDEQLKLLIKVESANQKNSLLRGQSLVDSIRIQEQNIITNSQSLLGSLNLEVNDKIFEFIPSFVDVLEKSQEISEIGLESVIDYSPQNESHEINLLEIEGSNEKINLTQKVTFSESPVVSKKEIEIKPEQVKLVPFLDRKVFDDKQLIKPPERKTLTKRQFPREKMKTQASQQTFLYTSRQTSFVSQKSIRLPKKKAKSIKVPQKYEKTLQALSADTLQTLDLTNAELGDNVMLQIFEIVSSSKVKTAKLIRNKLTDEGLTKILPFMGELVTLNLSQNLLTDKILDVLTKNRQMIPKIKNIVLSINKIVQRKDKKKIDELRALGITVSV